MGRHSSASGLRARGSWALAHSAHGSNMPAGPHHPLAGSTSSIPEKLSLPGLERSSEPGMLNVAGLGRSFLRLDALGVVGMLRGDSRPSWPYRPGPGWVPFCSCLTSSTGACTCTSHLEFCTTWQMLLAYA